MQISLARQVALVTGASSGIGAGSARALAAAGAAVVLNYHSSAGPAEELAREINDDGGRAIAIGADVSKEQDVERLFAQTLDAFGTLDILVANSGLQKDAAAVDMSLEDWNTVINVNLTGQFLCARAALRIFNRQGIRQGVSRAAGKIIHPGPATSITRHPRAVSTNSCRPWPRKPATSASASIASPPAPFARRSIARPWRARRSRKCWS
jgi:glucose 1-dehydrogenase